MFELNPNMQFEHSWHWHPGTGKVEGYFEDDGTLVCRVAEEVTLTDSFSLPHLRLIGGITPNVIRDKLGRITCESYYVNTDVYLIGSLVPGSGTYGYGRSVIILETNPRVEEDWATHSQNFLIKIVGIRHNYIGTDDFIIGPYVERSKNNDLATIPVGTILWKVKGLKLELIS